MSAVDHGRSARPESEQRILERFHESPPGSLKTGSEEKIQGRPCRSVVDLDALSHRHAPAAQGAARYPGNLGRAARIEHHSGSYAFRLLASAENDPGGTPKGRSSRE